MKQLILAATAAVSLASASSALAARAQVKLQQLASSGTPAVQAEARSPGFALNRQLAAGGGNHPDAHATQLAAAGGAHPQAVTDAPSVQYAASGFQYVRRSHGEPA